MRLIGSHPVSNRQELEQKLRAEAADAEHDSSAAAAADGGAAAMDEEESSSVKDGDKDGGKDLPGNAPASAARTLEIRVC